MNIDDSDDIAREIERYLIECPVPGFVPVETDVVEVLENGRGKRHIPTDEHKRIVEKLSAFGCTVGQISTALKIPSATLHKYYSDEINIGAVSANAKVAETLYRKALSGDTNCMIFWLKTRAKWKEPTSLEISGTDGAPVQIENMKLDNLSDTDLNTVKTLMLKASAKLQEKSGENK